MQEIESLLAELEKCCSDTSRIVRGEIELSVAAHYLRIRMVEGIQKFSGSVSNHVVPYTSELFLFDVDPRILKGTDLCDFRVFSRLTPLAGGTSISATIWAQALDGFVVSAGKMGINQRVSEFRKQDNPLRQKFSPHVGDRCNSNTMTNGPIKQKKQTCQQAGS